MKTLMIYLLMALLAVGLSATLFDFNNTSDLTSQFNSSPNPDCSNISYGGLGNSGSVSGFGRDIWTLNTGIVIPEVGVTTTISAYFRNTFGSGYGGIGISTSNVNTSFFNCVISSAPALGVYFHGGGGAFINDGYDELVDWYETVGDLTPDAWFKMVYVLTNQGANLFDAQLQIWNSDANGNLGSLFTQSSMTGIYNASITTASTIYPYFGFDGGRFERLDNFEINGSGGVTEPDTFSGMGAGTAANPYVITSAGQLNEVRNFLDSNFIVANDINLNVSPYNTGEGWEPIGAPTNSYIVLDLSLATGGSFTMTGEGFEGPTTTAPIYLPTERWAIEEACMYANMMGGHVEDLGDNRYIVEGVDSYNFDFVMGSATSQLVEEISFTGVFNGNGKTISNLYINRSISDNQGLFGGTQDATIINITLTDVNVTGQSAVGGLVGYARDTSINNCHSNGTITSMGGTIGGLVGMLTNFDNRVISNCSSSGVVNGYSSTGGLFGRFYGSVLNSCYSTCSVSGYIYLGGLAGFLEVSNANNCYATGAVSGGSELFVGGLIGYCSAVQVNNSYSTGAVTSSGSYIGGLFGYAYNVATGCYWNTATSGQANASGYEAEPGAQGRNTDEMTYPYAANTFAGWDFVNVWREDAAYTINDGYPALLPPDYLFGMDVPVNDVIVNVYGGNANNGSGYIPEFDNMAFTPTYTYTFVGTGTLTITLTTDAPWGAYYSAGEWTSVANSGGQVVLVIDFDAIGKGEVPVVLGDQNPTLPVELSSFTAIPTSEYFINLEWVTQSETNLSGYYIYRNSNESLTTALRVSDIISGTNSSQTTNYSYTDSEVETGNTYYYWLQSVEMDGTIDYHGPISIVLINPDEHEDAPIIPTRTCLNAIYPNPFNPVAMIPYQLKTPEKVQINIYNSKGQLVKSYLNNHDKAGTFSVRFDGKDNNNKALASGIYYCIMKAGKYSATSKMVLLK